MSDHIASQFIFHKNRRRTFDFSPYAAFLGEPFLAYSSKAIEQKKEGITQRTWKDNYLVTLERLLISLILFLRWHTNPKGLKPADLNTSWWHTFAEWHHGWIVGSSLGDRTKSKWLCSTDSVLLALYANQAIPCPLSLQRLDSNGAKPRSRLPYKEKSRLRQQQRPISDLPETDSLCFRIPQTRRLYCYSYFAALGHAFMHAVVKQLPVIFAPYATQKSLHNTWSGFLSFLVTSAESEGENHFFEKLQTTNFRKISDLDWEHYIYCWRDGLSPRLRPSSANQMVQELRTLWAGLSQAGLVPHVPIKGFKGGRRRGNNSRRKTLAQLSANQIGNRVQAEEVLWARIEHLFDITERSEAHQFVRALSAEIPPHLLSSLSVEQLIGEMHALNSKRLTMLRQAAEREFTRWYQHWCHGQEAIRHASCPTDELVNLVDSPLRSESERRRNSRRLFYRSDKRTCTGNILAYVLATTGGSVQAASGRFHHLARLIGSRNELHAYLRPHDFATVALWILLLVDTGANCEVVREVPADCLAGINDPHHKKIFFGAKLRADGQVIIDQLPVLPSSNQSLSSVQAITQYTEMSASIQRRANDIERKFLLLYVRNGGGVEHLTEWHGREKFKRLLSGCESLKGLSAVPSMIRPSVMMEIQYRHPGKLAAAQVLADHAKASTTLTHYTERAPVMLQYNLLIREFQERYQAVIIVSIDDAPSRLGLTKEQFDRVFSEAARTGLGVACLDPNIGIQPGTREGEPCTRMDRCCQCKMRWVVATPSNIADLILFSEYLKSTQNSELPERWEQVWLPWLVFSETALAKLKQGETVRAFEEGRMLAEQRRKEYKPIPLI